MSRIFIISDTHFDHKSIIDFCGRPDDFNERISKNLEFLTKNDLLIHLGDVGLGKDIESHQKFIEPIKCKKILVRGNHDKRTNSWYLEHGWDFVCENFVDKYLGKWVLFSHEPMDIPSGIDLNIHGHFHNNSHRLIHEHESELLYRLTDHHICFVIEDTKYKPLLIDSIMKFCYHNKQCNGLWGRDRYAELKQID